jgi:hypothetical protein
MNSTFGVKMNIGLILPVRQKDKDRSKFFGLYKTMSSLIPATPMIGVQKIELAEDIGLVVCSVPLHTRDEMDGAFARKRLKQRIDRIFEEERVWPVIEHPDLMGLYCSHKKPRASIEESAAGKPPVDESIAEIAADRFLEALKLVHGVGDLSSREIAVTGGSAHLEYAIARLITRVKSVNILLPEGSQSLDEAEKAFAETGIPVHITTDIDVLDRSSVWIRFPLDHISFDALPEIFRGVIVDIGNMKIIDTKNKKIFSIIVEFSDKMKRKLGQNILSFFGEGVLEGVIIAVCANVWNTSCTEASLRLGMKLSFKS